MFIINLNLKTCLLKWKRFLIFICLTALLSTMTGLLGNHFLYNDKAVSPIVIVIVDNDKSVESGLFYSMVSNLDSYKGLIIFEKKDNKRAEALLEENYASSIFTIPKDFAKDVRNGGNQPFSVTYNTNLPLKAQLAKYFADAFIQMLSASQIGIYTALDYAIEFGTVEQYAQMYHSINLKYLNAVISRGSIINAENVSVLESVDVFQYYFFTAYVFIILACSILFTDIIQRNFSKATLTRLKSLGFGSFRIASEAAAFVFLMLCLINIILAGVFFASAAVFALNIQCSPLILPCIALILLGAASFTVFVSMLFKDTFSAGVFVTVFSFVSLFLSGGIIPAAYFSDLFKTISKFTFNSSAVNALNNGMIGQTDHSGIYVLCVFLVLFWGLSVSCFYRNTIRFSR